MVHGVVTCNDLLLKLAYLELNEEIQDKEIKATNKQSSRLEETAAKKTQNWQTKARKYEPAYTEYGFATRQKHGRDYQHVSW